MLFTCYMTLTIKYGHFTAAKQSFSIRKKDDHVNP